MSDPTIYRVPNPDNPKEANSIWFEWTTEKNDAASDSGGVPVFDTVLLGHIIGPGLMRSEAVTVCERKKPDGTVTINKNAVANYGPMIDAFKKGEEGTLTGTPLQELAILDIATRASLKAMGVHNVEGLAAMNESAAPALMGFRKFKTAAQAFIDQREGQAPIAKLTAALAAAEEKNALLQANYDDLVTRVQAIEDKKLKKAA